MGNHGFYHLNGFNTKTKTYLKNVEKSEELIHSNLYRPPYGKMRYRQYKALNRAYRIILWDTMSYDFDEYLSAEECANLVIKHAKPGSIIVFHDNLKARNKVLKVLPNVFEYFSDKGYKFDTIQ